MTAQQLAALAQSHPEYWPQILQHPNTYPGLNAWIAEREAEARPTVSSEPRPSTTAPVVPASPAPRKLITLVLWIAVAACLWLPLLVELVIYIYTSLGTTDLGLIIEVIPLILSLGGAIAFSVFGVLSATRGVRSPVAPLALVGVFVLTRIINALVLVLSWGDVGDPLGTLSLFSYGLAAPVFVVDVWGYLSAFLGVVGLIALLCAWILSSGFRPLAYVSIPVLVVAYALTMFAYSTSAYGGMFLGLVSVPLFAVALGAPPLLAWVLGGRTPQRSPQYAQPNPSQYPPQ